MTAVTRIDLIWECRCCCMFSRIRAPIRRYTPRLRMVPDPIAPVGYTAVRRIPSLADPAHSRWICVDLTIEVQGKKYLAVPQRQGMRPYKQQCTVDTPPLLSDPTLRNPAADGIDVSVGAVRATRNSTQLRVPPGSSSSRARTGIRSRIQTKT